MINRYLLYVHLKAVLERGWWGAECPLLPQCDGMGRSFVDPAWRDVARLGCEWEPGSVDLWRGVVWVDCERDPGRVWRGVVCVDCERDPGRVWRGVVWVDCEREPDFVGLWMNVVWEDGGWEPWL